MTFRVGQKVVCIKGGPWKKIAGLLPANPPVVRRIYTIAEIEEGMWLSLIECGDEDAFHKDNFRPLVERKTDISCFQKLLLPTKARERA